MSDNNSENNTKKKSKLTPTPAKVYLYAEFLGVDLQAYPFLYDLMAEGLACELPTGWKIRKLPPDEDGVPQHEFYHQESGKTSVSHPLDEVFLERAQMLIKQYEEKQQEKKNSSPTSASAASAKPSISASMFGNDSSDEDVVKSNNNSTMKRKGIQIRDKNRTSTTGGIGKQIRYVFYCIVFASFLHFVTYNTVYNFLIMNNQRQPQQQEQQQQQAASEEAAATQDENVKN